MIPNTTKGIFFYQGLSKYFHDLFSSDYNSYICFLSKFGSYWKSILFDNLLFIKSLLFSTVQVIIYRCVRTHVCIYISHTYNPKDSWQIFEVASFRRKEVKQLAQSIYWRQDSNLVVWLPNSHLIFSGYYTTFKKKEKKNNLLQSSSGKIVVTCCCFFLSPRVCCFSFSFFQA